LHDKEITYDVLNSRIYPSVLYNNR